MEKNRKAELWLVAAIAVLAGLTAALVILVVLKLCGPLAGASWAWALSPVLAPTAAALLYYVLLLPGTALRKAWER